MKSKMRTNSSAALKRLLALAVLAALCMATVSALAAVESISFKYTYDRIEYTLGDQISVKYTISGGSGTFSELKYFCYSLINGQIAECDQGSLSKTKGTVRFTPSVGDEAYVLFTGSDSNGTLFSFRTDKVSLIKKDPDDIKIKFTPKKSQYYQSEDVSVNYRITGGTGVYMSIIYRCYIWDEGSLDECDNGPLFATEGTIRYKPTYGQSTYVCIEVRDSAGRYLAGQSGKIDLAKRVKPKSTTVTSVSTSSSKGKLTVKWNAAKYADGYQIEYSTHKDFSDSKIITVSGSSKVRKSISKLEPKKRYYIRVRSYKDYNGGTERVYSKWSKSKSQKTK